MQSSRVCMRARNGIVEPTSREEGELERYPWDCKSANFHSKNPKGEETQCTGKRT